MAKAIVSFRELIQDSQEYGSDDEHMVSRVFFDLQIGEAKHEGLYANIKQSVGGSFESSPLEVSLPGNYTGPFNSEKFSEAAEKYYRSLVGSQGSGIRIGEGVSNIRMRNNRYGKNMVFEFDISPSGAGW